MRRISVDIETLGSGPDAALVAIAAVPFDNAEVYEAEAYYATIAAKDAMRFGTVDGENIQWWMQQSAAARAEIYQAKQLSRNALTGLLNWVQLRGLQGAEAWANPASFDFPIIDHAYRAHKLPLPFHYRTWRCGRTLWALNDYARDRVYENPCEHHALYDAIEQAWQVVCGLKRQRKGEVGV